jgi:type III restriction enzyme
MLTEGWDCTTVTHIIGIRPFMSQLLCEQVVGRGLRRSSYEVAPEGKFAEEVAEVLGVPFEVIPFKANPQGPRKPREKRYHVHALPERQRYEVRFPRVEGYTQAIRNRVTIPDWGNVPRRALLPDSIPPEVEMRGLNISATGRPSLSGPGKASIADLEEFRSRHRIQELVFEFACALTKHYVRQPSCQAPAHVLFPQVVNIVRRCVEEKVIVFPPANLKDLFLAPYYGWVMEILLEAIRPDTSQGETPEVPRYESSRGPGSTGEVDYWTSREPREVIRSHVNYLVPDTRKWEQSAGYFIDTHPAVDAFVKNAGLGFAIPYLHNGQMHDYMPDFIVRLRTTPPVHLILETKGFDPVEEVKRAAAERWVAAVNADGTYGEWRYGLAKRPTEVPEVVSSALESLSPASAQRRQRP